MTSLKELKGMEVIDHSGQKIGKIDKVSFNEVEGFVDRVIIALDKGLFSKDKREITFNDIQGISDNVVLKIDIDMDE